MKSKDLILSARKFVSILPNWTVRALKIVQDMSRMHGDGMEIQPNQTHWTPSKILSAPLVAFKCRGDWKAGKNFGEKEYVDVEKI